MYVERQFKAIYVTFHSIVEVLKPLKFTLVELINSNKIQCYISSYIPLYFNVAYTVLDNLKLL